MLRVIPVVTYTRNHTKHIIQSVLCIFLVLFCAQIHVLISALYQTILGADANFLDL